MKYRNAMLAFHGIFRMQFVLWVVSFTKFLITSFFFPKGNIFSQLALSLFFLKFLKKEKSEPRRKMVEQELMCGSRNVGERLGAQGGTGSTELKLAGLSISCQFKTVIQTLKLREK